MLDCDVDKELSAKETIDWPLWFVQALFLLDSILYTDIARKIIIFGKMII